MLQPQLESDCLKLEILIPGFEMNHAGGMDAMGGNGVGGLGLAAPSDPVELRRLNFQTPGMMSHPPIPVHDLAAHIDDLKANDNAKFSQEYESIEPGES